MSGENQREIAPLAKLTDAIDLGSVTTVEYCLRLLRENTGKQQIGVCRIDLYNFKADYVLGG